MNILTIALLFSTPRLVCSLRGAGHLVVSEDGSTNTSSLSAIPCPGPFISKEQPEISKCTEANQMVLSSTGGFFCCTLVDKATQQWKQITKIFGQQRDDRLGYGQENGGGISLSGNGKRLVVSSRNRDSSLGKSCGVAEVYEDVSSPMSDPQWVLVGEPIFGHVSAEHFGWATAISGDGNVIAVSSVRHHGDKGSYQGVVRAYRLEEGIWPHAWIKMGGDILGDDILDYFGFSISLCNRGNILAIGAVQHFGIENKPYPGYVKVFAWDGNRAWVPLGQQLVGEDDGDRFGNAVSLSGNGNLLAVGAPDADTGFVSTFGFDGTRWNAIGQTIYADVIQDKTGYSVALSKSGRTLAIGAPHGGSVLAGLVRTYFLNKEQVWQLIGEIEGDGEEFEAGSSISISGDGSKLAIGAINASGKKEMHEGYVKIYQFKDQKWVPLGNTVFGEHGSDNFGYAVSIDAEGRRVAASAPFASTKEHSHAGFVKVLELQ